MSLPGLTEVWLKNPVWYALTTVHAGLGAGAGRARRYPAELIPFAGLETREQRSFDDLRELLAPGESIYLTGDEPISAAPAGFKVLDELAGLQMIYAASQFSALDDSETMAPIERLTERDVPAILELKGIAFPGYYGPRAPSLGTYYGIRLDGRLVAMAGERLALPKMREVSAVCTHPLYLGRGYAARLVTRLVKDHLEAGLLPFLHVAAANTRAVALYERLGFVLSGKLIFHHVQREDLGAF